MGLKADFSRQFPGTPLIQVRLDLDLDAPSVTVLFGPSGCGKTTVLRCLAGLERPDAGEITAGDAVWFHPRKGTLVPAAERGIGYVFQEPCLFPHLTVAGNIAFGLSGPKAERRERVQHMIRSMGLEGLDHRLPAGLSGGQKQRVALARALAPRPRLVLLDEPFASLDGAAADRLRNTLRQALHTLKVPAILVTHNPTEALVLGDRMLRMAEGRITREGTPAEILSGPEGDVGDPMGVVVRTRVLGRVEGLLRLACGTNELLAPDPGGDFQEAFACIRPEGVSLELGPHGTLTQRNRFQATVTAIETEGALTRVRLEAGFPLEALITTWAREDFQLAPGGTVLVLIKATAIKVVPIVP